MGAGDDWIVSGEACSETIRGGRVFICRRPMDGMVEKRGLISVYC